MFQAPPDDCGAGCQKKYGNLIDRYEDWCKEVKDEKEEKRTGMDIWCSFIFEQRGIFLVSVIKPCLHPNWGDWGPWVECPPGDHVKAMRLKIDYDEKDDYDDTVLNTIELKCTDGTKLTSKEGWWGKWEPWKEIDDPDENRIVGVWMKGEAPCGCCDDTAANGVRFVDLYDKTYRPGDYIFLS